MKNSTSFHNTPNLFGVELLDQEEKCQTQEQKILRMFLQHPYVQMTPPEVHNVLFKNTNTPLTSIRRAMTNLSNEGRLEKTNIQVTGLYGIKNYKWKLK